MNIEVTVTEASLADMVDVAYDEVDEKLTVTTLGDVIAKRLLDELVADPRWEGLQNRFALVVSSYLQQAAPGFVEALVAAEVARQLEKPSPVAAVRGKQSTTAEAIVATEVTIQLRAQFQPVVEQALAGMKRRLTLIAEDMTQQFVDSFKRSAQGPGLSVSPPPSGPDVS